MIYDATAEAEPIRQGDIFVGLPRIDLSLEKVVVVGESSEREIAWRDLAGKTEYIHIIVPVRSVAAIVVTQDCDALRSRDITLCEIRPFKEVEGKSKEVSSPKSWKSIITQQARINQKWFYLPPDPSIGFSEKMGVDFMLTLRIARVDLEALRSSRKGRLNPIADEHFRERIAEFFRRYPYDEWYPLNTEEMNAYKNEYPDVTPFPWQK